MTFMSFSIKNKRKTNLTINTFLYFIHISCTIQLELLNFNFFGSYWEKNSGDKKKSKPEIIFFRTVHEGSKTDRNFTLHFSVHHNDSQYFYRKLHLHIRYSTTEKAKLPLK